MAGHRMRGDERSRKKLRSSRFAQAMVGQTLAKVGEAVGLSTSTIHSYANGGMPSAESGIRVARHLGVDLAWWINGEGKPTALPSATVVQIPIRGEKEKTITYSSTFIESLNRKVDSFFCDYANGSSMYPTIVRGAELLCSTDFQPVKDGGVYLIILDNNSEVKPVSSISLVAASDLRIREVCKTRQVG